MARVPDTAVLSLVDDIMPVIQAGVGTNYITSVSNNGGRAQLNTSNPSDADIGGQITITGSTYYNGTRTVYDIGAGYVVITAGYAGNDTGSWKVVVYTLVKCFDMATTAYFDPKYALSGDRQSEFRNYRQGNGSLTNVDNEDDGGTYQGIDGNEHWFWITSGLSGLRCYDMSTAGILDLKDTITPVRGGFIDVWIQQGDANHLVFTTMRDESVGDSWLYSYGYNITTGVMTYAHSIMDGSNDEDLSKNVFGDGTNLIFVVAPFGDDGIRSYTYNSSGVLTYKLAYTADGAKYHDGVFVGTHLFVVGNNGVTSFTRNITSGLLTKVDISTESFNGTDIIYDSSLNLLIVGSTDAGIMTYSFDGSGNLTQEDSDGGAVSRLYPAYHSGANYLYTLASGTIMRHRIDINDDLVYIGYQFSGITNELYIWENAPDILIVADWTDGIRTYSIDVE